VEKREKDSALEIYNGIGEGTSVAATVRPQRRVDLRKVPIPTCHDAAMSQHDPPGDCNSLTALTTLDLSAIAAESLSPTSLLSGTKGFFHLDDGRVGISAKREEKSSVLKWRNIRNELC